MNRFRKATTWSAATIGLAVMAFAGQDLPQGDGRDLVAKKCTACHDLSSVVEKRQSKEEWTKLVKTMQANGYKFELEGESLIEDNEVPLIVDYLAKNFGIAPAAK